MRQSRPYGVRRVFSVNCRPNSNLPDLKFCSTAKLLRNLSAGRAGAHPSPAGRDDEVRNFDGLKYAHRRNAPRLRQSKAKARRLLPKMDVELKKEQEKQRLDRAKRIGPLCYRISITLMAMRPLLHVLQNSPEMLSLDLVESVTPLLEQLEASLQVCKTCPILDKGAAKILN